jgi:hypothetical protein
MWGPSIVGYGNHTYNNSSGRQSEVPVACFAIRGRDLVVYVYAEGPKQKALLSRVGKHKIGKSCLYFRQLADLDKSVLEKLVVGALAEVKSKKQKAEASARLAMLLHRDSDAPRRDRQPDQIATLVDDRKDGRTR